MKIYNFKCKCCGAQKADKLDDNTYKCQYCGYEEKIIFENEHKNENPAQEENLNTNQEGKEASNQLGSLKAPLKNAILFVVCLFFGYMGLHKLLERRVGLSIVYFFTCGLFGIGYIVDCVTYFVKVLKNKEKDEK